MLVTGRFVSNETVFRSGGCGKKLSFSWSITEAKGVDKEPIKQIGKSIIMSDNLQFNHAIHSLNRFRKCRIFLSEIAEYSLLGNLLRVIYIVTTGPANFNTRGFVVKME